MCSPCGPMICYKYEDCGPPTGKASTSASRAEEGGAEKKDEKENQLKRTKSRELRGGIMYYSCHCIKRNGLQHDCRRTGCGGEPACLVLPDPLCAPSQLARARGLADPAPLAAHMRAASGGGSGGPADAGSGSGKRFIVCELKGIIPDAGSADKGGKCCKCPCSPSQAPTMQANPPVVGACFLAAASATPKAPVNTAGNTPGNQCPCKPSAGAQSTSQGQSSVFVLDEKTMDDIFKRFESKELAEPSEKVVIGPGGRPRKVKKPVVKEPCTRPGCVHWKPPPPCVWDLPCKADCFEAPVGIQPGRNPLSGGSGGSSGSGGGAGHGGRGGGQPGERMKLLTPQCCTGCSAPGGGSAAASGGPAAGLPVMVMKLC
ncbi:uncharacterized protein [Choristoneura fumiferana]|uniref:uncharacterized protein n=1 Tax=Choristoneura fumiferana TaxID=7141 RepID=UPI003D159935